MGLFGRKKDASDQPAAPVAPVSASGNGGGISLDKLEQQAPGLVSLAKTAKVSLDKKGLGSTRAAVYLVLDYSVSMGSMYRSGLVQKFSERVLALGTQLDDDGTIPVMLFDAKAHQPVDVSVRDYRDAINRITAQAGRMGSTNYAAAIDAITKYHNASGADAPGLVVFQTDGSPDSKREAEKALRTASSSPLFFSFVGFGSDRFEFLRKLDDMSGRVVDNASFFAAGDVTMSDAELYDNLVSEFGDWIGLARNAGILR